MEQFKVTKQTGKVIIIVLLLFSAHTIFAASTKPASVLLQEGLYAEEVEGNLDEAIKIYQEVITSSQQMEQSAALATYRIGLCYLKKGDTEQAAKQFSELISKYPKQESLVKEAQKQLEKLQPPVTLGFTPVIELEIPYISFGKDLFGIECLIDFERAKLLSMPEKFNVEKVVDAEIKNWCVQNNLDAAAILELQLVKLTQDWYGKDNFVKIPNTSWNDMSPDKVKNSFQKENGTAETRYEELPATFAFKTLEGNFGLLQILSTTNETIKIRYKMVSQEREVFIPSIETSNNLGTGVVLDLATGEFLNAEMKPGKFTIISDVSKGDLAYYRTLLCTRGAKVTNVESGLDNFSLNNYGSPSEFENVTSYPLFSEMIPAKFIVTIAEGDSYELNILSVNSEGIKIRYAKMPPIQLTAKASNENEIKTLVANFFKAVSQNHNDDAMGMMLYEKTRAERTVKGFQTLPNIGEARADEIYSTQESALVVTTKIAAPDGSGSGRFAIRLIKKNNTWLIEEFDTDIDEEIETFKKESETNSDKDTNNTIQVLEKKPSDEEMLRSYYIACGTLCDSIRVALTNNDFETAEKLCQDMEMQIEKGLKLTSQSEQGPILESLASQFKVWHEAIKAKDKEKAIRLGEALNHAGGLVSDFIMNNKSNDEK